MFNYCLICNTICSLIWKLSKLSPLTIELHKKKIKYLLLFHWKKEKFLTRFLIALFLCSLLRNLADDAYKVSRDNPWIVVCQSLYIFFYYCRSWCRVATLAKRDNAHELTRMPRCEKQFCNFCCCVFMLFHIILS